MTVEIVPDAPKDRGYVIFDMPALRDPAAIQGEDALRKALKAAQDELILKVALCADAQQQVRDLSRDVAALAVAWRDGDTGYVQAFFDRLWQAAGESCDSRRVQ
ncbi:hypothetical protein [Methylogaea oryzae]|uniref:Uncharacterized protein n=1 Tax=Methylogaea oryzae TaxID=1295382 RepID=A0A8D4VQ19_9GAMM|nr:hypothetical protein [Methylogaea oryzae]BBL70360.1 hypothetical protein MoryE10_09660 [Methylogaea oryzae]